jgi:hypothetical protein
MKNKFEYVASDGVEFAWYANRDYVSVDVEELAGPYSQSDDKLIYTSINRDASIDLVAFLIKNMNITEDEILIRNID